MQIKLVDKIFVLAFAVAIFIGCADKSPSSANEKSFADKQTTSGEIKNLAVKQEPYRFGWDPEYRQAIDLYESMVCADMMFIGTLPKDLRELVEGEIHSPVFGASIKSDMFIPVNGWFFRGTKGLRPLTLKRAWEIRKREGFGIPEGGIFDDEEDFESEFDSEPFDPTTKEIHSIRGGDKELTKEEFRKLVKAKMQRKAIYVKKLEVYRKKKQLEYSKLPKGVTQKQAQMMLQMPSNLLAKNLESQYIITGVKADEEREYLQEAIKYPSMQISFWQTQTHFTSLISQILNSLENVEMLIIHNTYQGDCVGSTPFNKSFKFIVLAKCSGKWKIFTSRYYFNPLRSFNTDAVLSEKQKIVPENSIRNFEFPASNKQIKELEAYINKKEYLLSARDIGFGKLAPNALAPMWMLGHPRTVNATYIWTPGGALEMLSGRNLTDLFYDPNNKNYVPPVLPTEALDKVSVPWIKHGKAPDIYVDSVRIRLGIARVFNQAELQKLIKWQSYKVVKPNPVPFKLKPPAEVEDPFKER